MSGQDGGGSSGSTSTLPSALFFFNDTATTEIYTLSLHDALPIFPNLLRSKMAANEASAVGSLRSLNTACITYSTTYGSYPTTLASLGPAATASSTTADLIDSVLSSGTESGYSFAFAGGATTDNIRTANHTTELPS